MSEEEATDAPQGRKPDSSKFREGKFTYHQEVEVDIATITNLGDGLGRIDGWVVFVPGALPGEKVVARIWHNAANFSRGDLVRVIIPSAARVQPRCELFGECGGCQYQNMAYAEQLVWKRKQVAEVYERLGGLTVEVEPTHPSPKQYGYRSKITPHFMTPRRADFPIGFLAAGTSRRVVDVPSAPSRPTRSTPPTRVPARTSRPTPAVSNAAPPCSSATAKKASSPTLARWSPNRSAR